MDQTTLVDAVKVDRRTALVALRDELAAAIQKPERPAHTTAPLARQLAAVLREIDEMPDPDAAPSLVEELQQRVQQRRQAQVEASRSRPS